MASNTKHNDKSHYIKSIVRVKPINNEQELVFTNATKLKILVPEESIKTYKEKIFTFSKVYDKNSKTSTIYKDYCFDLVESVYEGYNGTILAYGPPGAGKTYTMFDDPNGGIATLIFEDLFSFSEEDDSDKMIVNIAFMEIYEENVIDLLSIDKNKSLKLLGNENNPYVERLVHKKCEIVEDCLKYVQKGLQERKVSKIENYNSSRGHVILKISVKVYQGSETDNITEGVLYLVDLAGGKRFKESKVAGLKLKESTETNKSILELRNVIDALALKQDFVPYRNSSLTMLLKNALGGNSKTIFIANFIPSKDSCEGTLNCLNYANKVQYILNNPIANKYSRKDAINELTLEYKKIYNDFQKLESKLLKWPVKINLSSFNENTNYSLHEEAKLQPFERKTRQKIREIKAIEFLLDKNREDVDDLKNIDELNNLEEVRIRLKTEILKKQTAVREKFIDYFRSEKDYTNEELSILNQDIGKPNEIKKSEIYEILQKHIEIYQNQEEQLKNIDQIIKNDVKLNLIMENKSNDEMKKYEAGHFYGGTLSAKPIRDLGTVVEYAFTAKLAYTRMFAASQFCNLTTLLNRGLIGGGFGFNCRAGCSPFSLNQTVLNFKVTCTSFSVLNDWSYGESKVLRNITKVERFEASNEASTWRTLLFAPGLRWDIRIRMNNTVRFDTNKINTTPYTLLPPVLVLRMGTKYTLNIPTYDDDEDVIKCRWSERSLLECGSICKTVPIAFLDSDTCSLIFNLTKPTIGWYGAAIQIEDFAKLPAKTTVSSVAMSSVPIHFLINVVNFTSTCILNPDIIVPSCIQARVGEAFSKKINAKSNCPNVTVVEIIITGPLGLFTESTAQNPSDTRTSYTTINWKPDIGQLGFNLACGIATDSVFLSSKLVCMPIFVTTEPISDPELVDGSGYPMYNLTSEFLAGVNGFMTFRAAFNVAVTRPDRSTFVYITDNNGTVFLQYDCSTSAFVYYIDNMIFIDVPVETLPVGDYFISFDNGTAIGTGYCKNPSPEKKNFWPITVSKLEKDISTSNTTSINWCIMNSLNECNVSSLLLIMSLFFLLFHVLHFIVLFSITVKMTRKSRVAITPVFFTLHVPSSYKFKPK